MKVKYSAVIVSLYSLSPASISSLVL